MTSVLTNLLVLGLPVALVDRQMKGMRFHARTASVGGEHVAMHEKSTSNGIRNGRFVRECIDDPSDWEVNLTKLKIDAR